MFALPDLPYAYDALEPVISDRTMRFHHDKHHAAYVKKLNELLEAERISPETLESVIVDASNSGDRVLFNNAAQAWNHTFFWSAMSARREKPTGELASAIDGAFGDLAGLRKTFVGEGVGHFGSGWVWLTADKASGLRVRSTHDADGTVSHTDMTPLIVCDLWEHAYYLDHQNDRKGFLEAWFDTLPSWEFAAAQYRGAVGRGKPWRHPAAVLPVSPKKALAS
ncbi:MAG TPA: superoxide dismutase [Alphaproteobacteria bacterium]|nr:superoxide dismutase [Alphaproteobacteria bacterium]